MEQIPHEGDRWPRLGPLTVETSLTATVPLTVLLVGARTDLLKTGHSIGPRLG